MSGLSDFHYLMYGPEDGRKWVFVHGLMGYANNWRKIISGIESTERCLSFDQRGHGRSIKPESGYTPEDYANDILNIINELGWQKIILMGHSMGGRNVMNFTARFPERVEKLIIEDIGPEIDPGAAVYYQNLLNIVPTPFQNRAEAKEFLYNQFPILAQTRENAHSLAQYFYANMIDMPDGTVNWRFYKPGILQSVEARKNDRWADLKALSRPTLLIRGKNSKDLSYGIYKEMLESNPMIKGVEIEGAGHWVHSDQPEAVIHQIRDFVGGFPG